MATAEDGLYLDVDAPGAAKRTRKRFSWTAVDRGLTRTLLQERYHAEGRWEDFDRVQQLSDDGLATQAQRVFGRPPKAERIGPVTDVLRDRWLPRADKTTVAELSELVRLSLSGPARAERPSSKREMVLFLQARNLTATYCANVRSAFIRAHQVEVITTSRGSTSAPRARGTIELVGKGAPDLRHPYPFQELAWRRLDELYASGEGARRGLVVLPTGAGKTFTMVTWLRDRLASSEDVRVLWLADQRELVDQAARELVRQASSLPRGVDRRLRRVHGAANLPTALADPDVDVVCATRQSVAGRKLDDKARNRLRRFLARPTVVVVDEAHHAVAPSYQQLVSFIDEVADDVMVVGLTATPWPSGQGMTRLLTETFPTRLVEVHVRDLVRDGVLARPVMHTVDTNEVISLAADELKEVLKRDIPPAVLRKLDRRARNQLIVSTWVDHQETWGKTLVFACDIEHADNLGAEFALANVATTVMHSQAEVDQSEALEEFRQAHDPRTLISVGMLLEGVDVPDARTAFLTRPTRSRVVMRQMIGRVLRGPAAGGESLAHVVDLRDRWSDEVDILAPVDIPGIESIPTREGEGAASPTIPPVIDELSGEPLAEDLLRRVEREFQEIVAGTPYSTALTTTELIGFYELGHVNVPVFEHQLNRWTELVRCAIKGEWPVWSAMEFFEDLPAPRPDRADIQEIVDHCRSTRVEPPMIPVRVRFSVRAIAEEILESSYNEREKLEWLRSRYESSLARASFDSFYSFYEGVQREVLALSELATGGINPEAPSGTGSGLNQPRLRRWSNRELAPLFGFVVRRGRELMEADDPDYRGLLDRDHLPAVDWTRSPVAGVWAYWTTRMSGRRRGEPEIRVNRQLQAPTTQVSDQLLEYLLWHELCHHLLPGRGHDPEFRRLEALWPDSARLDHELDHLDERFDLQW